MLSLLPPARPAESDWFRLAADIGRNRPNRRDDAIKVESLLANDGDAELRAGDGPAGRWSPGLDAAIRRFQKRSGLKVDGWLRPGGPTIEALRARQEDAFAGFDVPTPEEIEAHHAALAEGSDPLVAFAAPSASLRPIANLPMLRQADRDSNMSQLDWLDAHQIGLGEVPAQFARYVELGPQGIAQARDFVQQFQRRWPGERDALVDGILDRLDPDGQTAFLGGPRPQGAPFGTRIGGTKKPGPVIGDRLLRPDEIAPGLVKPHTMEMRGDRKVNLLERVAEPEMLLASEGAANDPQVAEATPQKPEALEILLPVPDLQIRKDGQGDGAFKAPREGNSRPHLGVDLVAPPGTPVVSPVTGTVVTPIDPYSKNPDKQGVFSGLRIKTDDGHLVDILYVKPDGKPPAANTQIKAGDPIGTAQDLSVMYPPNKNGPMTNHIHIQIQKDGRFIDPTPLLRPHK